MTKKEVSQSLKVQKALSLLAIVFGTVFIVYMITFESEPGAIPLFLILSGTIGLLYTNYRIRKQVK